MTRNERFMPNGVPKHLRIYDNGGESIDRYTVIYSGRWKGRLPGHTYGRAMSESPYSPQGFGQWFEYNQEIDRPRYSHLGKKITFADLPEQVKRCVVDDYCDLWRLEYANA